MQKMILIDNTVLSNFALAEEMLLLENYCKGKGATSKEVLAEFERGINEEIFRRFYLGWIKPINIENRKEKLLFVSLGKRLGLGESSCLTIAISRKYDLLSDDLAVRKIALKEGVRLSGSVGVLLELIKSNEIQLKKGNKILMDFIESGYFSPVDKLDDLL